MSDNVKNITLAEFDEEINSKAVAIVDFWASWCGPCKRLHPIYEEAADELQGEVAFYRANVDDERELAIRFDIMSIPTMLVFKNGELISTTVGLRSKEEIIELVK